MTKTFCDKCDKEITGMFDDGAKHVIAVSGGTQVIVTGKQIGRAHV